MSAPGEQMSDGPVELLNMAQVERKTTLHRTQIYRMIKKAKFPNQYRLKGRRVVWIAAEVDAWIRANLSPVEGVIR